MNLLHTITHPSRQHDVKFCKRVNGDGEILLIAAEDKMVSVYNISRDHNEAPTIIAEMIGHSNRSAFHLTLPSNCRINHQHSVKAVDTISIALPHLKDSNLDRSFTTIACTASSDGKINIYDLASLPSALAISQRVQIQPCAEYNSKGTRLTCITAAEGDEPLNEPVVGKRKRSDGDSDDNGHEMEDEDAWESQGEGSDDDGSSGGQDES